MITILEMNFESLHAAFSVRLGLFQYGLLHFGQTRGSDLVSRGIQVCSQRSQVYL